MTLQGPERKPKPKSFAQDILPLFIGAAIILFIAGGVKMFQIHSESGDSIMEEFFHALGFVMIAFACLSLAIGYHVTRKK